MSSWRPADRQSRATYSWWMVKTRQSPWAKIMLNRRLNMRMTSLWWMKTRTMRRKNLDSRPAEAATLQTLWCSNVPLMPSKRTRRRCWRRRDAPSSLPRYHIWTLKGRNWFPLRWTKKLVQKRRRRLEYQSTVSKLVGSSRCFTSLRIVFHKSVRQCWISKSWLGCTYMITALRR